MFESIESIVHYIILLHSNFISDLTRISVNVMFGNVTLGIVKKLEDYINYIIHEQNIISGCLNKILLFIKSFITDNLSFDTIK